MYLNEDVENALYAMDSVLYKKHPYGLQQVIGTQEHLKNPSILAIKKQKATMYVPNNVAICVSGDFDPDQFVAIVEKYFGDWEPNPSIPEFKYDYKTKLSDQLKDMGMEIAFSDYADFSGMLASGKKELKIGDIIHKTHIEVDREGTKAAAVTVVEMDKCEACISPIDPVFINLDRPFVYAIVDNETGVPVFLGVENNMQ